MINKVSKHERIDELNRFLSTFNIGKYYTRICAFLTLPPILFYIYYVDRFPFHSKRRSDLFSATNSLMSLTPLIFSGACYAYTKSNLAILTSLTLIGMNYYQTLNIDRMSMQFVYPLFSSILILLTTEALSLHKLAPSYIRSRVYNTILFLGGCYVFTYFYFSEKSHLNMRQKQLQEYDNKTERPDNTIIKYSLI